MGKKLSTKDIQKICSFIHDINNCLNVILGYTQLLLNKNPQEKCLHKMIENSNKLQDLLQEIKQLLLS